MRLNLRRWLLVSAGMCLLVGAATLMLALFCIFEIIGGQCELWLLGPFVALPLGLGLGLIGRAAGRHGVSEPSESVESQRCGEREET